MMLSSSAVDRVCGYRLETTAKLIAAGLWSPAASDAGPKSFRQMVATRGNGFRLYSRFLRASDLQGLGPVATTGLHKGSIHCCLSWLRAAETPIAAVSGAEVL